MQTQLPGSQGNKHGSQELTEGECNNKESKQHPGKIIQTKFSMWILKQRAQKTLGIND